MIDKVKENNEIEENNEVQEGIMATVLKQIKKTLFPDVELSVLSRVFIFIVEFFHIIFSLFSPIGFVLPAKFLIYNAIGLTIVLLGWVIFDGCILTILKNKIFDIDEPLIDLDFRILKIFQVLLICLCLYFYKIPKYSPFNLVKIYVSYMDKL